MGKCQETHEASSPQPHRRTLKKVSLNAHGIALDASEVADARMAHLPGPKHRIVMTPRADTDLISLHAHISVRSPANADLVEDRVIHAIDRLCRMPRRYPIAPEASRYARELRHLNVSSYRILYEVFPDRVVVYQVRHASRSPAIDLDLE